MGMLVSIKTCIQMLSFAISFCLKQFNLFAFGLLQRMNNMDPRKLCGEIKTRQKCIIRSKVVLRKKYVSLMSASLDNFLLWSHPELCSLETLLEQGMSLYCITNNDLVVFVRTSSDKNCYRSETSPFFYMAQFDHAEEVYITSHRWLLLLTSEIAEVPRVPVTWLSNTGRCGSTLVCQMMERIPGTVCISEPEAIKGIAIMTKDNWATPEQRLSLLKSSILVLLYHATTHTCFPSPQEGTKHVLIKPQGFCTLLTRDVHNVCPQIRHVFMHRRLSQILQSNRELMERTFLPIVLLTDSDRLAAWTPEVRHSLFGTFFFGSTEDREALVDLAPSLTYVGIWVMKVGGCMKIIQRMQAEEFSIPTLLYDDILANPVRTVGSLLDHLQLSRDHLDAALSALSKESQSSVPVMVRTKHSSRRSLTDREQQDMAAILDRLQLRMVEDVVQFRHRIGHDQY